MKKFTIAIMVMFTIIVGLGFSNEAFGDEYSASITEAYDQLPEVALERFERSDTDHRWGFISQSLEWNENTLKFRWRITLYDTYTDCVRTEDVYYSPQYLVYVYESYMNS